MPTKYTASRTGPMGAIAMLVANGLTSGQAMDLKNEAEQKKGEKAIGNGGWMIAHADGTYSSGAA